MHSLPLQLFGILLFSMFIDTVELVDTSDASLLLNDLDSLADLVNVSESRRWVFDRQPFNGKRQLLKHNDDKNTTMTNKGQAEELIAEAYEESAGRMGKVKNAPFWYRQYFPRDKDMTENRNFTERNMVYVLPGEHWSTSEDKVLVLASHYDTFGSYADFDAGSSGVAAMLEVIRVMSHTKLTGSDACSRSSSIVFVSYGKEEAFSTNNDTVRGSGVFIEEMIVKRLLGEFNLQMQNILGVILMKGIMNRDNSIDSQRIPLAMHMMHPDQSNEIAMRGNKGDFVAMLSRKQVLDKDGNKKFGKITANFNKFWKNPQTSKEMFRLINFPFEMNKIMMGKYRRHIQKILPKTIWNFWNMNHTDSEQIKGIDGIVLTDTLFLRGYMRVNCSDRRCDNKENAMTPNNLEQYRLVVQTLVKVIANYYGCKVSTNDHSTPSFTTKLQTTTTNEKTTKEIRTTTISSGNQLEISLMFLFSLFIFNYILFP